ncbi:MAG: hypothetical protein IPM56_11215 [Ignavibacteriales bacterium]|nr:MAG: hypothetical protein IPM56_11215 [Ignavibacteriales bacterium]
MNKKLLINVFLFVLVYFNSVFPQEQLKQKFVLLPFYSIGVDSITLITAESILRTEISKLSSMEMVSSKQIKTVLDDEACNETECMLEAGKKLNADKVLLCRLSSLGEKIITQYFLIDVKTENEILIDQITALNVEELEIVMKRVASSVVKVESAVSSAEVGNIIEQESLEPLRRGSRKNIGLAFGYLFPMSGYDGKDEKTMVFDFRAGYELEDATVGMMLGIRKGFAMNIYGSYLLTKTDVCPYIGGAFGFHWVTHNNWVNYGGFQDTKKDDGFELTLHSGLRLFRTYNFQVMINLDFIYTLNDFNDKAVVLTIGIL